jgi:CRP/FNR family transcriptional regulator, cyclic AMP receptor protein
MSKASDVRAVVEALAAQPRFAECNIRDLERLARAARQSSIPAAWPLIHEFTPADSCYLILDGELEVTVERRPVARLGAGSVVGEAGLFNHNLRNATVVSVTPVTLLHLPAEEFHHLTSDRPAIRTALCGPSMAGF